MARRGAAAAARPGPLPPHPGCRTPLRSYPRPTPPAHTRRVGSRWARRGGAFVPRAGARTPRLGEPHPRTLSPAVAASTVVLHRLAYGRTGVRRLPARPRVPHRATPTLALLRD